VTERTRDEEISELRHALAGLIGRNVELQQRVEALELERNELGLDEVARSLVRTARLAEDGMAEVAAGDDASGVRYVIPRLDVSMRGTVGRRGDGLGIRFAGPEQGAAGPTFSTISMSVAHVPLPPGSPVPREVERFRAGLEAVQATLSAWDLDRGRSGAAEIAAQATRLLDVGSRWGDAETVGAIGALVEAIRRFQDQAGTDLDRAVRDRVAPASRALAALAKQITAAGSATPQELESIGSLLATFAGAIDSS